jgi:ribosomal protein S18 acetylase RimI-like enzyme
MSRDTTNAELAVRAATHDDRATLAELIGDGTDPAYRASPLYFLRLAFEARPEESRAIVAVRDGIVVGGALFGLIAGAVGTGRIHFITVAAMSRRLGIASRLCEAAVRDLARRGARNVVVELPDDRAFTGGGELLARCDFAAVARVADYYRDGVALVVLNRAVSPPE